MTAENKIPHIELAEFSSAERHARIQNVVYSCQVDHEGTIVYVKGLRQTHASRTPILVVHDLAEDTSYYRAAAQLFAEAGHSFYCFDMRGHGRSGREPGHVSNFKQLLNDLLQVVAWVRHKEGGKKPIIIGQGIGALTAINFGRSYSKLCAGIVLCAPTFFPKKLPSPWERRIVKFLADWFPKRHISLATARIFADEFRLSNVSEELGRAFGGITANFAQSLIQAVENAQMDLIQIKKLPVLALIPENDPLCNYDDLINRVSENGIDENITIEKIPTDSHYPLTESDLSIRECLQALYRWNSELPVSNAIASETGTNFRHLPSKSRKSQDFAINEIEHGVELSNILSQTELQKSV